MFRERERFGVGGAPVGEVERLCRYLRNDSLIRWRLGCSQAEIDAARKRIAKGRSCGFAYLPPAHRVQDETAELRQREKRAIQGNERYLAAVKRAHG